MRLCAFEKDGKVVNRDGLTTRLVVCRIAFMLYSDLLLRMISVLD